MSLQTDFQDQLSELRYRTRTGAVWAGGRTLRAVTGTSVSGLVSRTENFNGLDTYMLGTVGIGLSIAVKVFIANQEHDQQIRRLASFYRNEIGAYLGMKPALVGEDELKLAAQEIPSLQDALERNDKRRVVKLAAWVGGTVLAGALMLSVGVPLIAGLAFTPFFTSMTAAAAGMGLFYASSELLERTGKLIAGTKDPTAHDHTRNIARQLAEDPPYPVTEMQVFEVFLAANEGLRKTVEQALGCGFSKLDKVTQEAVLRQYEPLLKLQEIADDLNNKQIRPQELMFRVSGRESGIARLPEPPRTQAERLEMQMKQGVKIGRERAGDLLHEGQHRAKILGERAGKGFASARDAIKNSRLGSFTQRAQAEAASPAAGEISR